jgi:hypothetical protein
MSDDYHLIHAQGKLIAAQAEQIAALERRVVRLEQACANLLPAPERPPIAPVDHLANMLARSTDEVVRGMAAVVDDKLMSDIVSDNRGR